MSLGGVNLVFGATYGGYRYEIVARSRIVGHQNCLIKTKFGAFLGEKFDSSPVATATFNEQRMGYLGLANCTHPYTNRRMSMTRGVYGCHSPATLNYPNRQTVVQIAPSNVFILAPSLVLSKGTSEHSVILQNF